MRGSLCIEDYSVSQTSLEQIFNYFAAQQEEEKGHAAGVADNGGGGGSGGSTATAVATPVTTSPAEVPLSSVVVENQDHSLRKQSESGV